VNASNRVGPRALAALLPDLDRQSGPRYRALSSALTALLLDGRLAGGTRLPSERDLAAQLRVSRATATAAYDDLASNGMLLRRRGSGSYLILPAAARVAGPGARMARNPLTQDTIDLSIASLPAVPGLLQAATLAALEPLGRLAAADGYHPYGLDELRDAVAARYRMRGVETSREQILITNGAQHAFDLILRALVSPGDRVLTELPSYPGALEAIKAHSARTVAVPLSAAHGWDSGAIANALLQTAPRLAYLIPDFHNPTGSLIPTAQRRQTAAAARRSGTRIVVDESFIDIDLRADAERIESPLPMAALDPSGFSIGSLSKPIWGGLRIGWIRADVADIQRLAVARARGDMSGAVLEQLVALELLRDLDANLGPRLAQLGEQRDALLAELTRRLPGWRAARPAGGLSAWVELDAPAATPLTHLLEHRGILISPGSRFAPDGALERFLRIPFALPTPRLVEAVAVLAQTWTELDPKRHARTETSLVTA
jgi:DNA-binding transcriptional MocR family regulator